MGKTQHRAGGRRTTSMKPLIFATLAMFSLSAPVLAQAPDRAQLGSGATTTQALNPNGNLAGAHTNRTTSNDPSNPVPHIYHKGEHISPSYGEFSVVEDWAQFNLSKPPMDQHWVKYGDNYLLVDVHDG